MGFETWRGAWTGIRRKCAFESSLWDLKQKYLKAKPPSRGFESSLWDLKHNILNLSCAPKILFESSLWDLKQPSISLSFITSLFESSLWDLKLLLVLFVQAVIYCLKAPYGIWNSQMSMSEKCLIKMFESSLWDLKRCSFAACRAGRDGLKAPYGIWNQYRQWYRLSAPPGLKAPYGIWNHFVLFVVGLRMHHVWKLPMGFETFFIINCTKLLPSLFESSLWDLKLVPFKNIFYTLIVWKLPMGFETAAGFNNLGMASMFESSLWDLKLQLVLTILVWLLCLKAPYGIWNHDVCGSRRKSAR